MDKRPTQPSRLDHPNDQFRNEIFLLLVHLVQVCIAPFIWLAHTGILLQFIRL